MSSMDRTRRDTIAQYGDAPTTPTEALDHVLTIWADAPDDQLMVTATTGIYGDGVRTGLTMGDLRALDVALRPRLECPECGRPVKSQRRDDSEHHPKCPTHDPHH